MIATKVEITPINRLTKAPMNRRTPYEGYAFGWSQLGGGPYGFRARGEESPDITEHGAWRKPGRGDPTESATETNRRSSGR